MINKILDLLASADPRDRARGWILAWENRAELRDIAPEKKEQLLQHYLEEKDLKQLQLATAVIVVVIPDIRSPDPQAQRQKDLLSGWLWAPFQAPSIVFSTTEPKPYRRDERAEFCVARRLGYQTKFERVLLGGSEWQASLSETTYQAVCFIGRFGLYRDYAQRRLVNKRARFEFPQQVRPPNLQPNEIDDDLYHCIFERVGSNQVDKYKTTVSDGKRIDYALVQRYPRTINDVKMILINLAGCTSLGTYAAAFWAAEKLFQPIDSTGRCIEVPPGIREDSVFEALLKVTASDTAGAGYLLEIERLGLFVDQRCWSPESHTWDEVQTGEICLLTDSNGKSVFLLDGRPARIKPNHTYGRLLTAMMRQKIRTGNEEMNLAELAADATIWSKKGGGVQTANSEKKAYGVLKNLRSLHLHSALTVRDDRAWLHPAVRFEGPDSTRPLATK